MKNQQYLKIFIITCAAVVIITACNKTTTSKPESTPNPATPTAETPAPASTHAGGHSTAKKININSAILSELDKLEAKLGIPALSNKIQAERPYKSPEDLVAKKVIDQTQFDQIKDLVTIEDIVLTGTEKDVDYLVKLGLMKGHLFVAKELLDLNKIKDAEPHIGHPVEEIYVDIEEQLKERKITEFKTELIALEDLVKAGAKERTKVNANFDKSMKSIDSAIEAIPAAQRESIGLTLQVINGLLDTANSEYGAAITDGKIRAAIEYQDSRGFIAYADILYQKIAAKMLEKHPQDHQKIAGNIKSLKTVWPSPIPPAAPVKTPAQVSQVIKAIEASTVD